MPTADSAVTDALLDAAGGGDAEAWERLLAKHRAYVRQVVEVRLEPALRARVDASDVVQETLITASRRVEEFLVERPTSFRVWLRRTAMDRLVDARRRHLAQKRDARRELSITDASSLLVAQSIRLDSAHDAAHRAMTRRELLAQVRGALESLSESDREIVLLRHAEGLKNVEVAEVLEIDPRAASKRYGRAIGRLSKALRKAGFDSM